MSHRRSWLLVAGVAALLAVGVGAYAVASAEGPAGSASPRSISVEGTASVPIAAHDSAGAATTVYREAMAKAIADGQAKAAYLAEKSGTTIGVATTTIEAGGYIECAGTVNEYAEYEGEQPDFGYGTLPPAGSATGTAAPLSAVARRPEEVPPRGASSTGRSGRSTTPRKPRRGTSRRAAT